MMFQPGGAEQAEAEFRCQGRRTLTFGVALKRLECFLIFQYLKVPKLAASVSRPAARPFSNTTSACMMCAQGDLDANNPQARPRCRATR
jgi:hypothetical protein